MLELDVNSAEDIERVRAELDERWGALDGLLHAVAYAPPDALGGGFLETPCESAVIAYQTSAFSLKALVAGLLPLSTCTRRRRRRRAGLRRELAWPSYDWMGVAKAALEAVARYLARELGPRGIRVNLVSAGPDRDARRRRHPRLLAARRGLVADRAAGVGRRGPGPVADAACFLLSPLARAITAEIVHVDGGYHAMGCAHRALPAVGA